MDPTKIKVHDHIKNELSLFKGAFLFAEGDFHAAMKIFDRRSLFNYDVIGWNLGARIMRIQAAYYCDFDRFLTLVDNEYEYCLKFVSKDDNPRYCGIVALLHKAKKNDYDFLSIIPDLACIHQWDPISEELIRFDDWVKQIISEQADQQTG